jgi:hypothetical protein
VPSGAGGCVPGVPADQLAPLRMAQRKPPPYSGTAQQRRKKIITTLGVVGFLGLTFSFPFYYVKSRQSVCLFQNVLHRYSFNSLLLTACSFSEAHSQID